MNASGQVVGTSSPAAVATTPSFTAAGPCKTSAHSADLQCASASTTVGRSWGRPTPRAMLPDHAFLYSGGSMQDLGTLGGTTATPRHQQQRAGRGLGLHQRRALTPSFTAAAPMQDLGTLGGTYKLRPYGINNSGQVVGYALPAAAPTHAFLYSGGSMQDLGTLGGTSSFANGINNSGQVVGWADTKRRAAARLPCTAAAPCKTSAHFGGRPVRPMASTTAGRSWGLPIPARCRPRLPVQRQRAYAGPERLDSGFWLDA